MTVKKSVPPIERAPLSTALKSNIFSGMEKRTNIFQANWFATILDNISDGVFTMNLEWKITFINRAAEEITGIARKEALGKRCSKIFCSDICGKNCPMQKTFTTKFPILNRDASILNSEGREIPVTLSSLILLDEKNEIIGGVETFQDLRSERKTPDIQEKIKATLNTNEPTSIENAVKAVEAQTIISALKRNNYNRKATANYLGIHKSTFFRKIKHLGIVLPQHDGRTRLTKNESQTTNP